MALLEATRGNTTAETLNFVLENCCNCGIPFMMPKYYNDRLVREPGTTFYCPNGHPQSYVGKTEAQKLKEQMEKDRIQNEKDLEFLQNRLLDEMNEKKVLSNQLKRVHKGVCPCCNRSFQNLKKHIENKHPELKKT